MIYLDYASTYPKVKYSCSNYAMFFNPNANYAHNEKRGLIRCEDRIKKAIGAKNGKVIFGGTSSQLAENLMNAILFDSYFNDIICSVYEHESFLGRYPNMVKNRDELKERLQSQDGLNKAFVVWQGANNLTGEVFPAEEIGRLCHEHNAFYICDMTAMIGHTSIPANIDNWCDCAIWSGHKIGTELGIGCMWISDRLDKWLNGFFIHGTPNLAGACAITDATECACNISKLEERNAYWMDLSDELYSRLSDAIDNVKQTGCNEGCWAINSVRLPGINADALQQYLASKSIYIGVGHSSCADNSDFRVLIDGYGLTKQEASEVIRISFGEDNNVDNIIALVKEIKKFKELYI